MQAPKYALSKNRSGYWEARWSERQPDGKYRSKSWSTGRTDKREAQVAAEGFFRASSAMQAVAGKKTVNEIAALYMASAESKGVGQTQSFTLRVALRWFGNYTPAEIGPDTVQGYTDMRRADGISDGTIRRDLGALVAALNWGLRHKLVTVAEMPHVELPPDSPPRKVFLLEQDEQIFWDLALADTKTYHGARLTRVTRFVTLALETAARTEAIEGLTWDRVDWTAGLIDFNVPGRRVTKKRRAVVPISSRLRPVLERAYRERRGVYVLDEPGSIRTAYENWVATTPYPWVHKHDLRRTWATLAARAGVDLFEIAGVLGDTIQTVMKNYAHHLPAHLKGAMEKKLRAAGLVVPPDAGGSGPPMLRLVA